MYNNIILIPYPDKNAQPAMINLNNYIMNISRDYKISNQHKKLMEILLDSSWGNGSALSVADHQSGR